MSIMLTLENYCGDVIEIVEWGNSEDEVAGFDRGFAAEGAVDG